MKLFILFILLSTTLHARRVMVTSFEPFPGRSDNGSQLTVDALNQLPSTPDVEYVYCTLPILYDQAALKAQECFENMNPKPDMVISTGENGCNLRLESKFMNLDANAALADNSGIRRYFNRIDRSAPFHELSTLPLTDMYCAGIDPSVARRVTASDNPGNFVCNNTAFILNRFFKERQIPYGFIHVPMPRSQDCQVEYPDVAQTIHTMIRAGVSALNRNTPEGEPFSCEVQIPLVQQVATLENVARINCENQMQRALQNIPGAEKAPFIPKQNTSVPNSKN